MSMNGINSLIGALSPQGGPGLTQFLNTIDQAAGGGKGNPDLNSLLGISLGVGGAAINLGPSPSNVNNSSPFNFSGLDNLLNGTGASMPSFVSSVFNNTPNLGSIFDGALGTGNNTGPSGFGGSANSNPFSPSLLSSVFNNTPDFNSSFNIPLFGGNFTNSLFGNPGFGNTGFNPMSFNNFNAFGAGSFGVSPFGGFGGGFGMPPLLSGLMGQNPLSGFPGGGFGFNSLFPMF